MVPSIVRNRGMSAFVIGAVALATIAISGLLLRKACAAGPWCSDSVRFIVGFPPGGASDMYIRVLAKHFVKYVPGAPRSEVRNMAGAGSLLAANYIHNEASADTIGYWDGSLILRQRLQLLKGSNFTTQGFHWIGSPDAMTVVCAFRRESGIKDSKTLLSSRQFTMGETQPDSPAGIASRILRNTLGLQVKLVSDFPNNQQLQQGIMAGELEGGCWPWSTIRQTVSRGDLIPVVQMGLDRHSELKNVPNATELARTGQERQLLELGVVAQLSLARVLSMPRKTSDGRVKIAREAFVRATNDPEFLGEARMANVEIEMLDADKVGQLVNSIDRAPAETVSRLRAILER